MLEFLTYKDLSILKRAIMTHKTALKVLSNLSADAVWHLHHRHWPIVLCRPVSYTHLDVYKRQVRGCVIG